MATIVNTWGSAPRPAGALVAIRDDGMVSGSVSGGCIEDDLISLARAGELVKDKPFVTKYGITAEQAKRVGLPCGGTLELVLEPLSASSGIEELLSRIERNQLAM